MKYGFFFTTLFCSIFTFSGFVNAAASPLMLKQENNNISVYQGTQKIDTLTTR
jgi:hypothetical protein